MGRRSVVVVRTTPATLDAYGDPDDTPTVTRHTLDRCTLAPAGSSEPTERGRQGVAADLVLYAPPDADLLSSDSVEIDGVAYTVEGNPAAWSSTSGGRVGGRVVTLHRAVG